MLIKPISNSPGYYISDTGKVFNSEMKLLKTWLTNDGYERIRLPSIVHKKKRVNRTIHLLVAEYFLNGGKYKNDGLQVNHIDGVKTNNNVSNLELVTGTENVNHAHNNGLYTYNILLMVKDIVTKKIHKFRSLRELCRALNLSNNYVRTRIVSSKIYPIMNRYVIYTDFNKYVNYISTLNSKFKIYTYDYVKNKKIVLTMFTQISVLYGLSYTQISRKILPDPRCVHYTAGYGFSVTDFDHKLIKVTQEQALIDRKNIWKKLAMSVIT